MKRAAHIEETAAYWMMRREQPDWTARDQADLDAWLDASVSNKLTYWRLEYGWHKVNRLAALRSPTMDAKWSGKRYWQAARSAALATAASIVVCLVAISLLSEFRRESVYETDVGTHETVSLEDGSKIELNTDTRVRSAVDDKSRGVWIDRGEAYFEVAHDPSRPFVVHAGNHAITVLGTRFSVRRVGDDVNVTVAEGRVRVGKSESDLAPIIVTAGDVVVSRGSSSLVTHKSAEQIDNGLSWRHGLLRFDQSTLADAASEFNRYNRKRLVVADSNIAKIRIGGNFESSNVEAFAQLLRQAYGIKVRESGEEIIISE